MHFQKRVKGGRPHLSSSVERAVRREVEQTARRFGVSMSFVVHTALCDAFGIDIERYDNTNRRRRTHGSVR